MKFKEFVIRDVNIKCMCGEHPMRFALARSTDNTVTISGEKEDVDRVVEALETLKVAAGDNGEEGVL